MTTAKRSTENSGPHAAAKPIRYTDEQTRAVTTRQTSIALAAGAGCGKTFVLTERFLAELSPEDPRPAEQQLRELAAITFTDPAARELRSRIRRKCYAQLEHAERSHSAYWLALLRALDNCRISTIHSFCGDLLRSHALEVGLDPLFSILDQASALVLQTEAIEDSLRTALAGRHPDALPLARVWGVEGLKQRISRLLPHHRDAAFPRWLTATSQEVLDAWQTFFENSTWPQALEALAPLADRVRHLVLDFAPADATAAGMKQQLLAALEQLLTHQATPCDLALVRQLATASRKPFTKKAWGDDLLYHEFKQQAQTLRDTIDALPEGDFTGVLASQTADLGLRLARLTQSTADSYTMAKQLRSAIDFDDMLHLAHLLLTDERYRSIRRQIQQQTRVLMVDEFQDTSRQQVEIVQAVVGSVAESDKLFVVGDDKQSIYRFRGAEPQVFADLSNAIGQQGRLPLSTNFRSQPGVLNFVNYLFTNIFGNGYQALHAARPQVTAEPCVEFLWSFVDGQPRSAGWTQRCRQQEAQAIAQRLQQLLHDQVPIVADNDHPQGRRAAVPGDVAILFRALSDVQYYEEALRCVGLDYYLVGGHAFYAQQEVYDVLHLLRSVASRCDELSLAGVLRSPFFSLADESLYWLAAHPQGLEGGLFSTALPTELPADERSKVVMAAEVLQHLRSIKDRVPVPELINYAVDQTGYDAVLLAEFLGERKLANLQKLIEQARAAATSVSSLDDFVTQLAEFTTAQPKEPLAASSPPTATAVRLMTIHQSKGLEFPVVVLPDLNRREHAAAIPVAYDSQLGPLVHDASNKKGHGLALYQQRDRIESQQESDRLFYVACTRAADYLILSSGLPNLESLQSRWMTRLAEAFDLEAGTPIHLSSDAPLPPQARVTSSRAAAESAASERARRPHLLRLVEQVQLQADRRAVGPAMAFPVEVDKVTQQRFSVTRLSGRIVPAHHGTEFADAELAENAIADGVSTLSPLHLGTLVHAVLERVQFDRDHSPGDRNVSPGDRNVAEWCRRLAPQHEVHHADAAAEVAEELVRRFLASPRGKELQTAPQLHREVEFVLSWPPDGPVPSKSEISTPRFLQGYLDCLYQGADGGWRVLDYKTNQVAATAISPLAANYELQMLVYGLAVEQTWGTPPTELILHFLKPGVEQIIPWTPDTRQRAITLISEAIEKVLS